MTEKNYAFVAGILFGLVALGHLWRIAQGADVVVAGTAVPMSLSWIAVIVTAILAVYGLWLGGRRGPRL